MIRVLVGVQNCTSVFRHVLREALMMAGLSSSVLLPLLPQAHPGMKEPGVHLGWQFTQVPTSKSDIKMQIKESGLV